MKLRFTKMHGAGNDFVVIDGISQQVAFTEEQIKRLADRHFGIGCDQILMIEKPDRPGVDFRYRIFNSDGGEVEQCGNGARCFARYVYDRGLTHKREIAVATKSGVIYPKLRDDGMVTVAMGVPDFDPAHVPFVADRPSQNYHLIVGDQQLEIGVVSMGNPHAVLRVDDIRTALVGQLGPIIEQHGRFPNRVNVGFMEIVDKGHIRLRVYERGAGETLACGTGACAAVAVARQAGLVNPTVAVDLPGGRLEIHWPTTDSTVWMTGPVAYVFEGTIDI